MKFYSQSQTGDLPTAQAITPHLIFGDASLALALGAGISTVRRWRALKLIPFNKTGHKTIVYCLPRVLAALERLETRPHGRKEGSR